MRLNVYNRIKEGGESVESKEVVALLLTIWSNAIATAALVYNIYKDKRQQKTAPKHSKQRKR